MTVYFLFFFLVISWLSTEDLSLSLLFQQFFRWLAFVFITIIFFNRISSFELMSALYQLKIPLNASISIGVALQFTYIISAEISKNLFIYEIRNIKKFPKLIISIIISSIRKVENIYLSILLFDIQGKIRNRATKRLTITSEFIIIAILLLISILFDHINRATEFDFLDYCEINSLFSF